jgi:GT2 family glycosyltransferase
VTNILVVILNYNTKALTEKCIKSILDKKWRRKVKIVVVDNASNDGSLDYLKPKFKDVDFIASDRNLGFAGGNNLALKRYLNKAEYFLILNSDTEVLEGSLDKLYSFAKSGFDICSPKLLNPDMSFQPSGGELPYFWPLFFWISGLDDIFRPILRLPSYQERNLKYFKDGALVGWVAGAAMLVSKKVFEKIGFLDDKIFMYGEDVDFCFRAKKAGFKIGFTDKAEIIHLGGASLDKPQLRQWLGEFRGLLYFYEKHFGELSRTFLLFLIYLFVALRSVAFLFVGKVSYAKTYAQILKQI